MDSPSFQTCLGIPVPQSVRELVQAPPISFPTRGDQETIQILQDFGRSLELEHDEINQACSLATGFSDIVIILERPRNRRWHKFDVPFDEFVQTSETLRAVDELIRFASKGARSIYTVTVLNAFSYQPDKNKDEQDQRCHEVLAQMLRAKKPKVVIRCHRDEYKDEWLKRIEQPAEDYRLERSDIELTEGHTTVVLQSFHPSVAMNYEDRKPEYRTLLIYHFVVAFSELGSALSLSASAEQIRKLLSIKPFKLWQEADHISKALDPRSKYFCGFGDETPAELRMKKIEVFDNMYSSLERVFGHSQDSNALGIAKAVLFWKQRLQMSFLYQQSQSSSNRLTLEAQFSRLMITERSMPLKYKEINKKATCLAGTIFSTVKQAMSVETSLREETIAVFEEHNFLIDIYIRNLSISSINDGIRIESLVVPCRFFEATIKDVTEDLGQEDFKYLFHSLWQLAPIFDAKEV